MAKAFGMADRTCSGALIFSFNIRYHIFDEMEINDKPSTSFKIF